MICPKYNCALSKGSATKSLSNIEDASCFIYTNAQKTLTKGT